MPAKELQPFDHDDPPPTEPTPVTGIHSGTQESQSPDEHNSCNIKNP